MGHLTLQAESITFSYDEQPVLRQADLLVEGGVRLVVLGANGSGKTTLLRCLSGALRPGSGRLLLGGQPVRHTRAGLKQHRQQVQLVLQDPDDQLFSADVRRDVSFGPLNLGLPVDQVQARVEEALELLGITALADRPVHQLSYGQRKRTAVAGAVAMQPCILLLDEPTAGLDPVGVQEMMAALARLEARGTTVVIATHDVDFALAWGDRAAVVTGTGVIQGEVTDLLDDAGVLARARLKRPWPLELSRRLGLGAGPGGRRPRTLDDVAARLGASGATPEL